MEGSSAKKIKSNPVTASQKEILIDFISNRKDMYTGKLTASYTREKMKQNWEELSTILNSVPGGPSKDWKHWRKTWVDLKKNTKARLSEERRYSMGTGGGPPLPPSNSADEKFLTIISPVAISGNEEIVESEVTFQFNEISASPKGASSPNWTEQDLRFENIEIMDISLAPEETQKTTPRVTPTTTTPLRHPKKRISKTTRLRESLKQNSVFLDMTKENLGVEKEYKMKKLELMKENINNKKTYFEEKNKAQQEIANAATIFANIMVQIATDVRAIKNTFFVLVPE